MSEQLPPMLECVLRAVLLREGGGVIPLTPREVATYDTFVAVDATPAQPPASPSLLFSWERPERQAKPEAEIIQIGELKPNAFAFAARDGKVVSPETRRKLSDLVQKLKQTN